MASHHHDQSQDQNVRLIAIDIDKQNKEMERLSQRNVSPSWSNAGEYT